MTQRQEQPALDLFIRNLKRSAPFGVAAYVSGYLLTVVALLVDGVETYGVEAPLWKIAGWTFYGTHRVKLEITRGDASSLGPVFAESSRQASQLTSTVPTIVYQLIPIATLAAAGFIIYRRSEKERPSTKLTVTLGTTVVAGYLPIGVLGRFLFPHSHTESFMEITRTTTVIPELTGSIVVLGLGYPLVCGALGTLYARRRDRQRRSG